MLEDEVAIVKWLQRSLSSFDYEVMDVNEPDQARVALMTFVVNAAILDIQLEAGSGLDVLEFIRSDASLAHLPLIVLTGLPELTPEQAEKISRGHAHLIHKPEGIDAIATTLDKLLDYPDQIWSHSANRLAERRR